MRPVHPLSLPRLPSAFHDARPLVRVVDFSALMLFHWFKIRGCLLQSAVGP